MENKKVAKKCQQHQKSQQKLNTDLVKLKTETEESINNVNAEACFQIKLTFCHLILILL